MRSSEAEAGRGLLKSILTAEVRRRLLAPGLVAGFAVCAFIGLHAVRYPSGAPASWMASSFLICAMVMLRGRVRTISVLACVLATFAAASLTHWPLISMLVFTVCNTAEAAFASWLLLRLSRTPRLSNIKQAAKLLAFVILPTTIVSSVIAAVACQLIYGRGAIPLAQQWFAGHTTGMILSLPTLLILATPDSASPPRRHPLETFILLACLAAFASAPFNALANVTFLLILPAATVFAFRLGLKWTVVSLLVLSSIGDLSYYLHPRLDAWGPPMSIGTLILIGQCYNIAVYLNGLFTGLAVNYQARLKEQLERRTDIARAARARALAASRAKTEFLATMSHEIRTPLNGVLGFTQVLLRGKGIAAAERRQVELIDASGHALLTVVNDILDFSKVEAGELALSPRPVRLGGVWRDVCAIVGPEAERKGLELTLTADEPYGIDHMVDDQRLKQVLFNLLNNAVKFTTAGSVTLAVTWRGERLRVEVRDTGAGIAPEALPRLFHRFSQADTSISRTHGGTGLGLAISKGLIEMMGGEIGVESAPGRGSTFWFELAPPVASAPAPAGVSQGARGAKARAMAAHVLLVDDHAINRKLGATVLELLGCTVDIAEDGLQAIDAVRRGRYDLVLMDVHMPVMDGIEATRAIRAMDGPASRVPIVSMTADVLDDQAARCVAAGMNDRAPKPIEIAVLQACLDRWVGRDWTGQAIAA